ncbi:MAG: hypothetical protein ABI408_04725 [Gemmatimonadaceae bacterium]
MKWIPMMFAMAAAAPALSTAQSAAAWPIAPGSQIRILSPVLGDELATATTVSVAGDTLIFRRGAESSNQALATSSIARLDVVTGTHSRKTKGALIGFALGSVVVGILRYATYQTPHCINGPFGCLQLDVGRGRNAEIAAGFGGIVGAIGGLIAGSGQTDTWTSVALPNR